MKKLVSVVVPAYNESACVDELAKRLAAVFDSLTQYDFEAVICENGSQDDTYEKLLAIRERDPRFKIVQLAHNFGMEGAVAAALMNAGGNAAIVMTADLQDPPELIPKFIERWEAGYDNVYGVIVKRPEDEPPQRRFLTAVYYFLLNRASKGAVPQQVSDFRLVDRYVYEAFNRIPHRFRMNRVVWSWVSGRPTGVEYERLARHGGRSSFNYVGAFFWGVRTLLSVSQAPLKWIGPLGLLLASGSFLGLIGAVARAFIWGVPFNGFGTLVSLDLMLFGFLFLLLSMVSEYLQIIYHEVRAYPIFVVRKKVGIAETSELERSMIYSDAPHRADLAPPSGPQS